MLSKKIDQQVFESPLSIIEQKLRKTDKINLIILNKYAIRPCPLILLKYQVSNTIRKT